MTKSQNPSQIYLAARIEAIPGWAEMGPEPFDLTPEDFRERLQPYRGEIKGVLTRGRVVAGIGNAYADEICFAARLHPYRKRASLSDEETVRLYDAMQSVLREAIVTLRERVGTIAEIKAHGRVTNFCRACQPGGLIQF